MTSLERELPWLVRDGMRPDVLLYQAGADPLRSDPYSPLDLGHDDLRERDRRVFEFARGHGIPLAWALAGGYTKELADVVRVHVNTFEAAAATYFA
jgi:acetoin utilization deacetylase AcuC-like enzyme